MSFSRSQNNSDDAEESVNQESSVKIYSVDSKLWTTIHWTVRTNECFDWNWALFAINIVINIAATMDAIRQAHVEGETRFLRY